MDRYIYYIIAFDNFCVAYLTPCLWLNTFAYFTSAAQADFFIEKYAGMPVVI